MATTAYIYDAIRTPRGKGKAEGSLHEVKPVMLGAGLLKALQSRHDLDTARVDDVIMGCVTPIGELGSDVAKTIVQSAGWDVSVPGFQLDRFCASGLESVNIAAMKIASGWEDLVVAGGVESMSRVKMGSTGGSWLVDPEIAIEQLSIPQGLGADTIATIEGWGREDVDGVALMSQQRAHLAQVNGYFDKSIVPVKDRLDITLLDKDEFIKTDTTLEKLGNLRPSFAAMGAMGYDDMMISKYPHLARIHHVHTPGNSSGIVDGASAVLIGSEAAGKDIGLTPRGRIVSTAVISQDPTIMLTGPGPAAKKCLSKAGMTTADIDLFEINEAFASVVLRFMKDLDIGPEVTNVNGGAIAMGHPLGATGAMLISIMLDELERRQLKRGLIALCAGGGQGIATIIERV
ncbi:MAG: acetyl-CoA C-acetyltransferase [Spongiibacteraceae bacterium]